MPTPVRLDEALTQIVNQSVQVCTDATAGGELLEDITKVVKGSRARARPDPPYLWVTAGPGTAEHQQAVMETWTIALLLSAFLESEDPQEAWLEAHALAARARSVVLRTGDLGLQFVQDVQSAELGPLGQQQMSSGRRFGAFARLDVISNVLET